MRLMESVEVTKCIKQDFCESDCTQKNLMKFAHCVLWAVTGKAEVSL